MLNIKHTIFLNHFFLYAIIPSILIIILLSWKKEKQNTIHTKIKKDIKKIYKLPLSLFYIRTFLLSIIVSLFLLILANPQTTNTKNNISKNGIDIVFAIDVSKSMEAQDLKPSRIQAAKIMIEKFISKLDSDRVGLVVFAGKPYTSVPLTFDYNIVSETLKNITTDTLNQSVAGLNGTAIGDALLMADNIIEKDTLIKTNNKGKNKKKKEEREKVIILLTDGDANKGVDPVLAAKSLKNIKIYTIGIGSLQGGKIPYTFGGFTQYQTIPPLNEKSLRQIADISYGKFFRATDNQSFKMIFDELSALEKHNIKVNIHKEYSTNYKPFIYILIIIIMSYFIIQTITFKD